MQKWGRTKTGKVRWFCRLCAKSSVQKRPDLKRRWRLHLFLSWLIGTNSLDQISATHFCARETLSRSFSTFWDNLPTPEIPKSLSNTYLVADAIYLSGHNECVLIGRTGLNHVFWLFARQETLSAWTDFIRMIPKPRALICDGQSGLLSAVKGLWPGVRVQRCLPHMQRLGTQRLTRRPKTHAGQELLRLVYETHAVKTAQDRGKWLRDFEAWGQRWERFLKERTHGEHPGGKQTWWYTHRRIRAMKYTLTQALDNLFAHVECQGVPSTTNLVEGGINSRIKELLHRHRGMSLEHKKTIVAYFLNSRNRPQKPTPNVT